MENNQNVCLAALASTIFAHGVGSFFFPRELPMAWQSVDSIATKPSQVSFLVGLFRTVLCGMSLRIGNQFVGSFTVFGWSCSVL
jgi:hypothetical protein